MKYKYIVEKAKSPYNGLVKIEIPHNMNCRNRSKAHIKFEDGREKTTLYSRYLMETYLNRFLNENENVDHIDGDYSNNNILNLQVLTKDENTLKMYLNFENKQCTCGTMYRTLRCPICGNVFKIQEKTVRSGLRSKKKNGTKIDTLCCSRSCGHVLYNREDKTNIPTLENQTLEMCVEYTGLYNLFLSCGPHGFYKIVKCLKNSNIENGYFTIPIYIELLNLAYSDNRWADVVYYAYWKNAYNGFSNNCGESLLTRYNMMNFIGQYEIKNRSTYEYMKEF